MHLQMAFLLSISVVTWVNVVTNKKTASALDNNWCNMDMLGGWIIGKLS